MRVIKSILLVGVLVFFGGCATMTKDLEMENQRLRTQISTLESEIKERDLEIDSLEIELNKLTEQAKVALSDNKGEHKYPSQKSSMATKQFNIINIQIALKNAGFDPGPIDGKIGKKTRSAIKNFQKSQGLIPDGIVGNRTWEKLKEFLDKKIK